MKTLTLQSTFNCERLKLRSTKIELCLKRQVSAEVTKRRSRPYLAIGSVASTHNDCLGCLKGAEFKAKFPAAVVFLEKAYISKRGWNHSPQPIHSFNRLIQHKQHRPRTLRQKPKERCPHNRTNNCSGQCPICSIYADHIHEVAMKGGGLNRVIVASV